MLSKVNLKLCAVVFCLFAGTAHADGGLMFLEKNLQAQKETKNKQVNHGEQLSAQQNLV